MLIQGQIQGQLAQQRAQESEVSSFIRACMVMEQKVATDIQVLRGHWEKYGYKAPRESHQRAGGECERVEDDVFILKMSFSW